jgi:hypothetical protein
VFYFILALAPFIFYKIQGVEKLHADYLQEEGEDDD